MASTARCRFCLKFLLPLCGLVFLTGCGGLVAFYGVFIDPLIPAKTIKAQHSFKDKTVMVWVEPLPGTEVNPHIRRMLNSKLIEILAAQKKKKTARVLIPYDRMAEYRILYPDYSNRNIVEIGKYFHADEILSVVIERLDLHHEAAEGFYNVQIVGSAEVIRTADGARLWPITQTRQAFTLTDQPVEGQGEFFENELIERMGYNFAIAIGPWFYDHKEKK